MVAVAQGKLVSPTSNPRLRAWIASGGVLTVPFQLEYAIFDVSTDELDGDPEQVYPPSGKALVDLEADVLDFACYGATWDVPSDEALGRHEIVWTWTLEDGGAEYTYVERFDVLAAVPRGLGLDGYLLVSDLREEGFDADDLKDVRALKLIASKSRDLERFTGFFFSPRYLSVPLDGTGARTLLLGSPIIAVQSLVIGGSPFTIPSDSLKVYNRHLRGLLDPDDRHAPKIEFTSWHWLGDSSFAPYPFPTSSDDELSPGHFPANSQNVALAGLFGFTEMDAEKSPIGRTPELVREIVLLMVQRQIPVVSDGEANFNAQEGHRVIRIKTRDQEIQYANKADAVPYYTGDPEIDRRIAMLDVRVGIAST